MTSKAEWLKFKMASSELYSGSAEFADNKVDAYYKDLIRWLAMEGSEAYADEALELGVTVGIFNILREGQRLELMDAWDKEHLNEIQS